MPGKKKAAAYELEAKAHERLKRGGGHHQRLSRSEGEDAHRW
jgi:hypothetical protein